MLQIIKGTHKSSRARPNVDHGRIYSPETLTSNRVLIGCFLVARPPNLPSYWSVRMGDARKGRGVGWGWLPAVRMLPMAWVCDWQQGEVCARARECVAVGSWECGGDGGDSGGDECSNWGCFSPLRGCSPLGGHFPLSQKSWQLQTGTHGLGRQSGSDLLRRVSRSRLIGEGVERSRRLALLCVKKILKNTQEEI